MSAEAVAHVPELSRYELRLDDQLVGLVDYVERDGRLVVTHTEIQPAHGGRGLGGRMTRAMLDDIRRRGRKVTPRCPFTAHWIRENPEYADLAS